MSVATCGDGKRGRVLEGAQQEAVKVRVDTSVDIIEAERLFPSSIVDKCKLVDLAFRSTVVEKGKEQHRRNVSMQIGSA